MNNYIFSSYLITNYFELMEIFYIGPNGVGAIRLWNSGSTLLYNTAGRVQVWYGGEWGNICDGNADFGFYEADVVCHQLGWSGSSSYSTGQDDRLAI